MQSFNISYNKSILQSLFTSVLSMKINSKIYLVLVTFMIFNAAFAASSNVRILQETPPETEQEARDQIAEVIAQKQAVEANRSSVLANLTAAAETAKQLKLDLIDAELAVEASYRAYYNERLKCDGLDGQLGIIGVKGQISPDECLQFPIPSQAVQLFTQLAQLEGFKADVQVAQQAYNIQSDFAADMKQEQDIYTDLANYFQNRNSSLHSKFANMAFNTGNTYFQQAQQAALKKQILDGANANVNSTNAAIQLSKNQLASLVAQCNTNLANLRADLNTKLAAVAAIKAQIETQAEIILGAFAQLADILAQLKELTERLNTLADQYAAIVAAL